MKKNNLKIFVLVLGIIFLMTLISAFNGKNLNYKISPIQEKNLNSFYINSTSGEVIIKANASTNVLDLYNYFPDGWSSIDFYIPNSNGVTTKFLTLGVPGQNKVYKYYRGNNYINNYEGRGLEIQLQLAGGAVPIFTVFNNSMTCINCQKKYIAQNITNTLTVIGNISSSEFIESNGTINSTVDICISNGNCLSELNQFVNKSESICNEQNEGKIYYNKDTFKHYGCNSTEWNELY